MSVSVQVTGILGRRMEVAVPAERVEKAFSLRLQTVGRTAKIKGFRPGKAPLDIVRRQYGGQVRDEVVNELIGQALGDSLRQENLQPVGQPQVEPLSLGSGEDLRFAAHFEVYPTVNLQGHEGMELSLPQVEVGDADVDAMIETLRKQRPVYVDAGRAAADQDRVTVDFEGTLDGVPFDGGKAEGIAFVLGANDVVNPLASEPGSPIYGMPILDAHKAHTVVVNKRSMAAGYAGVDNPVFFKSNNDMLLGDARRKKNKR